MVADPDVLNPVGGAVGWFIFLVLLTETNDIAQALVGRRVGAHSITPKVSPHKTWEGLVGGIGVTMAAAMALAPLLTPLTSATAPAWTTLDWLAPLVWPLAAGLAIALAGFLGDLNISAVKRDAGVKDSSHALPGMGGVLDRIDSLTLTAPVFYWLIVVPTS
jgi:phosphatidate cytidylyltransferase